MKTLFAALTLSLLFGTGLACAATDNLAVTVEANSWYNRFVPISRLDGKDTPHASWALMTGPTVKARYKDMYLSVAYLFASNDYRMVNTAIDYGNNATEVTSSAARTDLDVVIGYHLTPQIDVNAGYKGIYIDDALRLEASRGDYTVKREENYNLGTLGAGLTLPLGTRTTFRFKGNALLGSFNHRLADPNGVAFFTDSNDHYLAWGGSGETGVTSKIIGNLSAGIGVKYQYVKAGTDNSNFFGPTARIDYQF